MKKIFTSMAMLLCAVFANATDYVIGGSTQQTSKSGTATYTSNDLTFTVTNSSGKTADKANKSWIKYSKGVQYTIALPTGLTVTNVNVSGYSNADNDAAYVSELNNTSYQSSDYTLPAGKSTDNTSSNDITVNNLTGSFTITFKGAQACAIITLTGTYDAPAVTQVETPKLTTSTPFTGSQTVEITCATDGATIYYTTDGTDPTTSSTKYEEAFEVSKTTTVKAFGVYDGLDDSEIAEATYTLWTPTTLQSVSEETTWDFSTISEKIEFSDETTPSKSDEVVYSDLVALGLTSTNLGSNIAFTGQFAARSGFAQAGTLRFNTTVAGTVTVTFSNTGGSNGDRYLQINGENTNFKSSTTSSTTSDPISVEAGEVKISGSGALRYMKVVFTPAAATGKEISVGYQYTTHCYDVALDFTGLDVTPYYVSAVSSSEATLSTFENNIVPAETGFIVKNDNYASTKTITVPEAESEGTSVVSKLEGVLVATDIEATSGNATNYILYNGEFVPTSGGTLGANRAYLPIESTSTGGAKLSIVFGDATGINEVNAAAKNGKIYNLQGIEVKNADKGLFIINGKKVIK